MKKRNSTFFSLYDKHRLSWFLRSGDRLSQRVIHAGFWVLTLRTVNRLAVLSRTVVLARLLAPWDFGLFSIALLALSTLETFSQTGFNTAIIQKKGDVRLYLDTAWTIQVIRGFLLGVILLVIAPYVAIFFGEPKAAFLMRALAVIVVLRGFVNIGIIYFRKELEFHKEFIYNCSGIIVDLAVAIPVALILRNAWALIFGLMAGEFVRVLVSYLVHPYRPRPQLKIDKLSELFTFGRWVFAATIVAFVGTQVDSGFVAKFLGASALGLYQMASRFSNLIIPEVSNLFDKIAFPTYALLQDNQDKLRLAFLKVLRVVIAVLLPTTSGVVLLAHEFVHLLLGGVWISLTYPLQILAIAGFLQSILIVGNTLFRGCGYPQGEFIIYAIRAGVIMIAIYPLLKLYGIHGAAYAVLLGVSSALPFWWKFCVHIVRLTIRDVIRESRSSISANFVMVLVLLALREVINPGQIGGFIAHTLIGASTYLFFQVAMTRKWGDVST